MVKTIFGKISGINIFCKQIIFKKIVYKLLCKKIKKLNRIKCRTFLHKVNFIYIYINKYRLMECTAFGNFLGIEMYRSYAPPSRRTRVDWAPQEYLTFSFLPNNFSREHSSCTPVVDFSTGNSKIFLLPVLFFAQHIMMSQQISIQRNHSVFCPKPSTRRSYRRPLTPMVVIKAIGVQGETNNKAQYTQGMYPVVSETMLGIPLLNWSTNMILVKQ